MKSERSEKLKIAKLSKFITEIYNQRMSYPTIKANLYSITTIVPTILNFTL